LNAQARARSSVSGAQASVKGETIMSDTQDQDREQRIRDIAYGLWEKEGQPEGRTDEFWHRAVQIVDGGEALPHAPAETPAAKDDVDLEIEQSFPASDPPSFSKSTAGGTQ
jgi:Protein of unknown function (DUF2934)